MSYYLESKRIPPERLVFHSPQNYDRILNTYDISGAKAVPKPIDPNIHGNSLKVADIKGAQPKRNIRSHHYTGAPFPQIAYQQSISNQVSPIANTNTGVYIPNAHQSNTIDY